MSEKIMIDGKECDFYSVMGTGCRKRVDRYFYSNDLHKLRKLKNELVAKVFISGNVYVDASITSITPNGNFVYPCAKGYKHELKVMFLNDTFTSNQAKELIKSMKELVPDMYKSTWVTSRYNYID